MVTCLPLIQARDRPETSITRRSRQWLSSADAGTAARVTAFTGSRLEELLFEGGYGLYEIVPSTR